MPYKITDYSKKQAKHLGLTLRPSKKKGKKLDAFDKEGKLVRSFGGRGYKDFPTFLHLEKEHKVAPGTAHKRRASYKRRHTKDRKRKYDSEHKLTAGFLADKILW